MSFNNSTPISDAEFLGAMPSMDTATCGNRGRLPANAEQVVEICGISSDRSKNNNAPATNGCLYVAFDCKVLQSSRADLCPPGFSAGFSFPGLDSRTVSLAQASQADLRRCLGAILQWNPDAPVPQQFHAMIGGSSWNHVALFCKNAPHNVIGKWIKIVTGSPKGKSGWIPMQFFPVTVAG